MDAAAGCNDDNDDGNANDQLIDGISGSMRASAGGERRLHVDDLSAVQRYLLGATALDCSLMITFQRLHSAADVDR